MNASTVSAPRRELARLETLCRQGALEPVGFHFARAVAAWGRERGMAGGGEDEDAALAVLAAALLCHLAGAGHVCVDLALLAGRPLPFDPARLAPALEPWRRALAAHPACGKAAAVSAPPSRIRETLTKSVRTEPVEVRPFVNQGLRQAQPERNPLGQTFLGGGAHVVDRPMVLDGHRLYLARHWHHELRVAADLAARMRHAPAVDAAVLEAGLARIFGDAEASRGQREAAAQATRSAVTVISGGPGTGKTTTLAALLALIVEQWPDGAAGGTAGGAAPRIQLAAPTGKAAARMQEAVRQARARLPLAPAVAAAIPERAGTLHRLLGLRPDGGSRHHAGHPLPLDVLVVDEASMVDLTLMQRLLAALPPGARLVLLGDRDQLASVEAGAVFADLCLSAAAGGVLAPGFAQLSHSFRFGDEAGIGRLARCLRDGDGAGAVALLQAADRESVAEELQWQSAPDPAGVVAAALAGYEPYLEAVRAGASAQELHRRFAAFRLLAAHRRGPWGVERFNAAIERALAQTQSLGHGARQPWYAGRPVMVAANDYALGLFNGDIGIAAPDPQSGELRVWFEGEAGDLRAVAPQRLPACDPAWALTVHKSQGSEFDAVLLALPDQPSPLVTRELVYTAVTRAKRSVRLWAGEAALREACRKRIERYSGLAGKI